MAADIDNEFLHLSIWHHHRHHLSLMI